MQKRWSLTTDSSQKWDSWSSFPTPSDFRWRNAAWSIQRACSQVTVQHVPVGFCDNFMENSHLWLWCKRELHKHVERPFLWNTWKMLLSPVVNFNEIHIQDKIKLSGILLFRLKRVQWSCGTGLWPNTRLLLSVMSKEPNVRMFCTFLNVFCTFLNVFCVLQHGN